MQDATTDYGSLGELSPSWWIYDDDENALSDWITNDKAFDLFIGWLTDHEIELWPHQEEALMSLMMDDHVILATPTGSGKSLVALGMHFMAMASGRRSYYTAPIKALVSEKFFSLVETLGRDNVGMITGDASINADAPVICCTAEILANQALREGDGADIGCVCMDEFHYYADRDRGWAWQVPLITLPKVQFLLMSATLGDTSGIQEQLTYHSERSVTVVDDAPRPVPLEYEYVETSLEATVELAARKGQTPLYIVHFAQDAALKTAQSLASYGVASKEQREMIKHTIKGAAFSTGFGKTLRRLLLNGVGVHHAGMLPRYRLLVEKLAQQGVLQVICGTDTLGVGINVPIHTVVFTALSKYDGKRTRRLRAREFHQIAGRAGRAGFDTEGLVIAEAPEHDIENAKALAKAGGDPKKARKIKRKKAPEGFVGWNKQTFEKLIDTDPEALQPRMRMTHAIVLAEIWQGGDARTRIYKLIEDSAQTAEEKLALRIRADEIIKTLVDSEVVKTEESENCEDIYTLTIELPDNFALDQPLAPFMLAALELLDPLDESYALNLISMVEATLENPWQVLRAQERKERDRAIAEMKADGIEYEERMEKLEEVTYPMPLADMLDTAFEAYCKEVPWARDYELKPKSVLRDMVESASDFNGYIRLYGLSRSEGTLLRYLSDAFRVLSRTVPLDKRDEYLDDIIAWLGYLVRSVDSSLIDAWENAGNFEDIAAPTAKDEVVADRHGLTVAVRNALMTRVQLAARGKARELGDLDSVFGYGFTKWQEALDAFFEEHDEIILDADARSKAYIIIDESDEKSEHVWHVRQIIRDSDDDRDFCIAADVDLDATQEGCDIVFANYRVGFIEEL